MICREWVIGSRSITAKPTVRRGIANELGASLVVAFVMLSVLLRLLCLSDPVAWLAPRRACRELSAVQAWSLDRHWISRLALIVQFGLLFTHGITSHCFDCASMVIDHDAYFVVSCDGLQIRVLLVDIASVDE